MGKFEMFSLLNGSIMAGPRPNKKLLNEFVGIVNVVVTLQWETEQPEQLGQVCESLGFQWIWVPIKAINWNVYIDEELKTRLISSLQSVKSLLEEGKNILIHCAAGIHRTGFFVYTLLRLSGFSESSVQDAILTIRPEIISHIGKHRLRISENFFKVSQNESVFTPYFETLDLKQSDFVSKQNPIFLWVKTFFHGNLAKVQFCATPADFSKIVVGGEVFMNVVERFVWSDLRPFKAENMLVESVWDCEDILFEFIKSCQHKNDIYLAGDRSFFDIEMLYIYFPRVFQLLKKQIIDLSSYQIFNSMPPSQSIYDDIHLTMKLKENIANFTTEPKSEVLPSN